MPTAYSLQKPYVTRRNQSIRDFTFCPERRRTGAIATIGVAVHEHGHALGMFDLYDLSEKIVGVGRYDVMRYGIEPDAEGFEHPTHFGASSEEFLGWLRFPANPQPYGIYDFHLAPAETGQDLSALAGVGKSFTRGEILGTSNHGRGLYWRR
jgi:hypothetical protein